MMKPLSFRAMKIGAATSLVLACGLFGLTGCGSSGSSHDNGAKGASASASGGDSSDASAPKANYDPEDPHNLAYWQGAASSVASGFDVAGVKLDMTIDQVIAALKKSGFTMPNDSEIFTVNGYSLLEEESKTNPNVSVRIEFRGASDENAKWTMGDAMRVAEVRYIQKIPGADAATVAQVIHTLIGKAESKYGKADELVLAPHDPGIPEFAMWGDSDSRKVFSDHADDASLHYSNEGLKPYNYYAVNPLLDPFQKDERPCFQSVATDKITDEVLNCEKAVWKRHHVQARRLAPILLAGSSSEMTGSEFDLVLYSPYKFIMLKWAPGRMQDLAANQEWHKQQVANESATKKAAGDTAF